VETIDLLVTSLIVLGTLFILFDGPGADAP